MGNSWEKSVFNPYQLARMASYNSAEYDISPDKVPERGFWEFEMRSIGTAGTEQEQDVLGIPLNVTLRFIDANGNQFERFDISTRTSIGFDRNLRSSFRNNFYIYKNRVSHGIQSFEGFWVFPNVSFTLMAYLPQLRHDLDQPELFWNQPAPFRKYSADTETSGPDTYKIEVVDSKDNGVNTVRITPVF